MEFLMILIFVLLAVVFIRYEPKIDIVVSKDNYVVLLWFNKYFSEEERDYIELFTI